MHIQNHHHHPEEPPQTTPKKISSHSSSHSCHSHIHIVYIYFYHHCGKKNVHLITSWWLNQPKLKNMIVKMGSSSPGIGVEIKKYLSCQPPRKISQFYIYHFYKLPIWVIIYHRFHLFREPNQTTIDPFIPSKTQSLRLGRISKVFLKLCPGAGRLGYGISGIFLPTAFMPSMGTPLEGLVSYGCVFFGGGWCSIW